MRIILLFVFVIAFVTPSRGQTLKAGFNADEYIGVLKRASGQVDVVYRGQVPKELFFERIYRSPNVGMHNKWDLWLNKDRSTMAIDIRGTTSDPDSWLENFYSAMVSASGTFTLNDSTTINYKFANDPKAKVHVGWAIGTCSIIPGVEKKILELYAGGTKQLIIEGHSQGGAIAFLLTSYLRYRVAEGKLPSDLVIKTYCSAAPKPGNLYYAYDFEFITRGGWAFCVVNAADWVPETPFAVQTIRDINLNPYTSMKEGMRKQSWLVRYYVNHMYNKLCRGAKKAHGHYQKYLGRVAYKQVKRYMPELKKPTYAGSSNYVAAGTRIVLEPDQDYYKKFPDSGDVFRHHLFEPYYYLVSRQYK